MFSYNSQAINIAIFQYSEILNNSTQYKEFQQELNNFKEKIFTDLKIDEEKLLNKKIEIEDSKILFNEEELKNQIAIYNEDIKSYQEKINKYNNFLNDNMEINQKKLIDEIFLIVKDISIENNFDLVFNEDQYFISNENIDISELVLEKLNHQQFDLDIIHYQLSSS